MLDSLLIVFTGAAAIGSGVIGGVFFAFSAFIMRAFARLSPSNGIAAMQMINVTVLSPVFMSVFLGTAFAAAIAGVGSLFDLGESGSLLCLAGAALYLIGVLMVTGVSNVPRNNQLMVVDPENPEGQAVWNTYLREWTAWNTVRAAASIAACVAFVLSLKAS